MASAEHRELRKHLRRENWVKAIEVANEIRARDGGDEDAVRGKVYALVQQGKVDQALELASRFEFVGFERAYCLYKKGDYAAALEAAAGGEGVGMAHVRAQCHYRLGDVAAAAAAYHELLEAHPQGARETVETLANLAAAGAEEDELDATPEQLLSSYEFAYNVACARIRAGDLAGAQDLLRQAEDTCRASLLAEQYTSEEIHSEVTVVLAQLAFVRALLGHRDVAAVAYKVVLKSKPASEAVAAVAANNLVALRGRETDLFDSFKRLRSAEASAAELSEEQARALHFNKSLLLAYMRRGDELRQSLGQHSESDQRLLRASLHFRLKEFDRVAELLREDGSLQAQLALAQTLLATGDVLAAARALEGVAELRRHPATVATLAALYAQAGDDEAAMRVFDEAPGLQGDAAMLEACGAFKLERGRHEEAAACFERIVEGGAGAVDAAARQRAMAKLVLACSQFDQERAERFADRLPAVAAAEVDLDALEGTSVAASQSRRAERAQNQAVPASAKPVAVKTKRSAAKVARRRARLRERFLARLAAAGKYDEARPAQPDPERWIPRYMRGRRGRRRGPRMTNASQGAEISAKEAARLDAAGRAARRAADDKPQGVVISAGSGQRNKNKKKKKKR